MGSGSLTSEEVSLSTFLEARRPEAPTNKHSEAMLLGKEMLKRSVAVVGERALVAVQGVAKQHLARLRLPRR